MKILILLKILNAEKANIKNNKWILYNSKVIDNKNN